MLIDPIISALRRSKPMRELYAAVETGQSPSFAMPPNVRSVVVASVFRQDPRPMLVIISGEEAANRFAIGLRLYLGKDTVLRFPLEDSYPWSDKDVGGDVAGTRLHALSALHSGEPKVVVASTRSLMRLYPPEDKVVFGPIRFATGRELDGIEYEDLPARLAELGYRREDVASEPGTFSVHGDAMDVFSSDAAYPVRIEFFGDEVDRIRKIVPSTGQTVCDLDEASIYPAREVVVTQRDVQSARNKLKRAGALTYEVEAELESIAVSGMHGSQMQYMPFLFDGTSSPMDLVSDDTLTVLVEPRSLFDDASRYHDELQAAAKGAKAKTAGLYAKPADMRFDRTQTLSVLSLVRSGTHVDGELKTKRGASVDEGDRFLAQVRSLMKDSCTVVVGISDRRMREDVMLQLTDEHIPISVLKPDAKAFAPDVVNITDSPISQGVVIPSANLALLNSMETVSSLSENASAGVKANPTAVAFPFKPGDYVVHQKHGIAHFTKMEKQEVDGIWRDYLVLEYAEGDKLFIPVEQIGKVTKYVGSSGEEPKLTRLGSSDWSRAQKKASKAAKKLAFDLVDLYVRRSSVQGHVYPPDTEMQKEMEALFPYEETSDQARAIADVKADMESPRPMDRLICGDVGYGKTEVAIRAAFKAVQDDMQVMVLCPTTILAQQHYTTFSERFESFPVTVEILSRFRTTAQQKKILEGFADGSVDILVGTHRLLSRDVNPKRLGLVIIDEEQKFGVKHKEQLKNLREHIDVLTLTATPIPRTLQMSLGGIRDMSLIDTPPSYRRPVEVYVGEWDEGVVSGAIRREVERGGQVYYVATRIADIDDAVKRVNEAAPEARVGFAHGRMSQSQLESVMEEFSARELDVLVSTTIIESGLDNPHTNTLIIEDSQMLGLSQLYQLKGRVGRSHRQAYAYFMFPQDATLTPEATDRLMAIKENQDFGSGIKIAMRDLEIRGAGSLLGAEQSGNISAIGFEAFNSMLSDYVAEARGGTAAAPQTDTVIDLPAEVYLPEDYVPSTEERVGIYRRFAMCRTEQEVGAAVEEVVAAHGELPPEAQNLVDRSYMQILMAELGCTVVTYVGGKVTFEGLALDVWQRQAVQEAGAIYYPKSKKLTFKPREGQPVFGQALDLLTKISRAGKDREDEG